MSMKTSRQTFGRWGEDEAARYLLQQGYTLLERNVRTPYGEIDLVVQKGCRPGDLASSQVTVFVEVKTRSSNAFGLPEESITRRKREHLLGAAQAYIQNHPDIEGTWRVDVIAIRRIRPGKAPEILHFEDALR